MTPAQTAEFAMTQIGQLFYRYEIAYANAIKVSCMCDINSQWPTESRITRLAEAWKEAEASQSAFLRILIARL